MIFLSRSGTRTPMFFTAALIALLILPVFPAAETRPFTFEENETSKMTGTEDLMLTFRSQTVMESLSHPQGPQLEGISLSCSDPEIKMGFSNRERTTIVVDSTPGSPMIPWIATLLEVGSDIEDISPETSLEIEIPHPGTIPTIPPPVSPWENGEEFGEWHWNEEYPKENVRVRSLGYRHREGDLFHVYSLWISPFLLGQDGDMLFHQQVDVNVTLSEEMAGPTRSEGIEGEPEEIAGTVSVCSRLDIPPEYLIITTSNLKEELKELADWRNRMGTATSIVLIENILEEYQGSEDNADLLREYIRDVYSTWDTLEHVLLAGDWESIPVKSVHDSDAYQGWDDGTIPADSYYQCLDGSWDLDGDGLFCEPGDMEDIIPDISVSRLAMDDEGLWSDKIDQIIAYENGPESGESEKGWSGKALLIGANTHNPGDGRQHSEYLWNKHLVNTYGEKVTLYEDEGTLSKSSIDDNLQEGASFVQFVDHGGPTVWCDNYGAGVVYRDRDAASLTNGMMLPVVSTLACLTTWFDDPSGCNYQRFEECMGEAFTETVEGGAIGYIGSSRTSVGILGANRYLPYDNGLQEDIARQFGTVREFTMGASFKDAKTHYAEVWGGQFQNVNNPEVSMCWLEFTLLGEPATEVWSGDLGELVLDVEHEDDLDPHIDIRVSNEEGEPVRDANVTLQNFARGVYVKKATDSEGQVAFDIALDWFCDINLSVTKHDHKPYTGYIRISDIIPPETEMVTDPSEPTGNNEWFLQIPNVTLVPNERAVVHYRIGPGSGTYSMLNSSMNYTLPRLGEGEHEIYFFGEDEAGNLGTEVLDRIKIDLNDPILNMDISPHLPNGKDGWYTTEPRIEMTIPEDDKGSPIRTYYGINGRDEQTYISPFYLGEGDHNLSYRAEDEAGRSSQVFFADIKVDLTPPETMISVDPGRPDGENDWYITYPTLELSSQDEKAMIEFRYSRSEPFCEYFGPITVPQGIHNIQYRAVDIAGNIGETGELDLKVDTSRPQAYHSLLPEEPDGLNGFYVTRPLLELSCSDNMGAHLFYSLDRGAWLPYTADMEIPDGEHTLEYYSVDEAGMKSSSDTLGLKIDTIGPVTTFNIAGARRNEWFTSEPLMTMEVSEEAAIEYRWDEEGTYRQYEGSFGPPGPEGSFTLYYRSTDPAGNMETEKRERINIDTRKPLLRVESSEKSGGVFNLDMSGSVDGTKLEFRITQGGRTLSDWSSSPYRDLNLGKGEHRITIEARDEAGNVRTETLALKSEDDGTPIWAVVVVGVLISSSVILMSVIWFRSRRKRTHQHIGYYGPVASQYHYGRGQMGGDNIENPNFSHNAYFDHELHDTRSSVQVNRRADLKENENRYEASVLDE